MSAAAIVVATALPGACRREPPVAPAAESPAGPGDVASLERALPARAGSFRGGPIERHDGFVRRRYVRGATSIEITVAYRPQRDDDYQQWMTASRDYPLATLDLPPSDATGFFSCADGGSRAACDLHIQLRAGYHVEVMGGGTATRVDLDQLMAAVPMAALITTR